MLRIPRHPAEPPRYAVCYDPGTVIAVVETAAGVLAAVFKASAEAKAGKAEEQAALARQAALEHQAEQARQIAGQERAASQRASYEQRRQARLLSSKALARAAASGAGAGDPTVENILGDIGAEGEFRALAELFMGEDRARNLEMQADLKVFEGQQERRAGAVARQAGRGTAFATLFSGLGKAAGTAYEGGLFGKKKKKPAATDKPVSTAAQTQTLARYGSGYGYGYG